MEHFSVRLSTPHGGLSGGAQKMRVPKVTGNNTIMAILIGILHPLQGKSDLINYC